MSDFLNDWDAKGVASDINNFTIRKVDDVTSAFWKETRLLYINLSKIDLNQTAVIGLRLR